jgi:hypothetical protein
MCGTARHLTRPKHLRPFVSVPVILPSDRDKDTTRNQRMLERYGPHSRQPLRDCTHALARDFTFTAVHSVYYLDHSDFDRFRPGTVLYSVHHPFRGERGDVYDEFRWDNSSGTITMAPKEGFEGTTYCHPCPDWLYEEHTTAHGWVIFNTEVESDGVTTTTRSVFERRVQTASWWSRLVSRFRSAVARNPRPVIDSVDRTTIAASLSALTIVTDQSKVSEVLTSARTTFLRTHSREVPGDPLQRFDRAVPVILDELISSSDRFVAPAIRAAAAARRRSALLRDSWSRMRWFLAACAILLMYKRSWRSGLWCAITWFISGSRVKLPSRADGSGTGWWV